MKYSLKNIFVEFSGWSLEFLRVRKFDFLDFRNDYIDVDESKYNEDGSLDVQKLDRHEKKRLRNVSTEFIAKNLVSAKCGDEVAESEIEKLTIVDFLSDDEDFRAFCEGYVNGEKKT